MQDDLYKLHLKEEQRKDYLHLLQDRCQNLVNQLIYLFQLKLIVRIEDKKLNFIGGKMLTVIFLTLLFGGVVGFLTKSLAWGLGVGIFVFFFSSLGVGLMKAASEDS